MGGARLLVASLFFDQYDRSLIGMALPQIQAGARDSRGAGRACSRVDRADGLAAGALHRAGADRIGRRRALLGTVMAYTALTGATALAPDPYTYISLQFLSRVFGTAEMLIAVVVISEELEAEARGWGVGAFLAIQACGVGLAAILLPIAASYTEGLARRCISSGSGRCSCSPGCGAACRRPRASKRASASLEERHVRERLFDPLRAAGARLPAPLRRGVGAARVHGAGLRGRRLPRFRSTCSRRTAGRPARSAPCTCRGESSRSAARRCSAGSATASGAGPSPSPPRSSWSSARSASTTRRDLARAALDRRDLRGAGTRCGVVGVRRRAVPHLAPLDRRGGRA